MVGRRMTRGLAAEAEALLLEARRVLGQPRGRERHRELLGQALELLRHARTDGNHEGAARVNVTMARAHAAWAEDARHGAGQMSLSAQRAPTPEACDDGWQLVEELVAGAEAAARATSAAAREIDASAFPKLARAANAAARAAEAAAIDARRIVEERNHAFTVHVDPGFSFGEGWYLAAAALLADVAIQIEPGKASTAQAERFLLDAGLGAHLQAYRPRPRAGKQTTTIVARAYARDPLGAQRALRRAFLGDGPVPAAIAAWADARLAAAPAGKKVLLWIRRGRHHADRNTTYPELTRLAGLARDAGLTPVLFGEALGEWPEPPGALDMTLVRLEPLFQVEDLRRAQLQLFEHLRRAHALVGQLGVTTAGMDGPALLGLPTMYLTDLSNVRMSAWVGAVPGYEEVVRGDGHLDRVATTLRRWAGAP